MVSRAIKIGRVGKTLTEARVSHLHNRTQGLALGFEPGEVYRSRDSRIHLCLGQRHEREGTLQVDFVIGNLQRASDYGREDLLLRHGARKFDVVDCNGGWLIKDWHSVHARSRGRLHLSDGRQKFGKGSAQRRLVATAENVDVAEAIEVLAAIPKWELERLEWSDGGCVVAVVRRKLSARGVVRVIERQIGHGGVPPDQARHFP